MAAYDELIDYLEDGEEVELLSFGEYGGWVGDHEAFVPANRIGTPLSLVEAEPFMKEWSFYGGYGTPTCHAVIVWTNQRVIFVKEYDGSTCLGSVPRHWDRNVPQLY